MNPAVLSHLMMTFRASCSITTDCTSPRPQMPSSIPKMADTCRAKTPRGLLRAVAFAPPQQKTPVARHWIQASHSGPPRLEESSAWRLPTMLWCTCSYRETSPPGSRATTGFLLQRFLGETKQKKIKQSPSAATTSSRANYQIFKNPYRAPPRRRGSGTGRSRAPAARLG